MLLRVRHLSRLSMIAATAALLATMASAQEATWRVGKSSGEVWFGSVAAQQVSLTTDAALPTGETIRTGKNGRVLLTRGEETILLGPNSEIALPAETKDGKTTILQRAGSILLEVEKKNVPHFEVMTPYLAAVVKGTQFSVSVDERGANVDVTRGQVEVADYKSGQYAIVLPGQAANVARGISGLSLTGSGSFNAIQRGDPRIPPVKLVPVPKGGFAGPTGPSPQLQERQAGSSSVNTPTVNGGAGDQARASATKITAPLGEVRMNVHAVTGGLARDASPPPSAKTNAAKDTVWSPSQSKSSGAPTVTSGRSTANSAGNAGGNGNGGSGAGITGSGNGGITAGGLGGPPAAAHDTGRKTKIGHQDDDNDRRPGRGPNDDDRGPGKGPKGHGPDNGRGPGRR